MDTDDDYVLLVHPSLAIDLEDKLLADGWSLGGSVIAQSDFFRSYKKGEVNLILTQEEEYFNKCRKATILSKYLDLTEKQDRIAVFRAVLEDIWP